MRILAAADFHGNFEALSKTAHQAKQSHVDVIVVCGDITHFGSLQQARSLLQTLTVHQIPLLFVPGNCDPPTLKEQKVGVIQSIHGKCTRVMNVNFQGVGGSSPSPFSTPFELSEIEIATVLREGEKSCQPNLRTHLVSHSPPKNTKLDLTFTGEHVGSISLRDYIEKTNPTLVLCGHIHEATGVDHINDTVIVNPGPAKHGNYAIIDLHADKSLVVQHNHL